MNLKNVRLRELTIYAINPGFGYDMAIQKLLYPNTLWPHFLLIYLL